MKKKFMAVVMAIALCFGMATTVMASYVENEVLVETTADADFEVYEYYGEEVSFFDIMYYLNDVLGFNITFEDVPYVRDFELSFEEGYKVPESGIQIAFTDENISTDKSYVVIGVYWDPAAGTEYGLVVRQLPATVKNGVIICDYTLEKVDEILYIDVTGKVSTGNGSTGSGAPSPELNAPIPAPSAPSIPAGSTEVSFTGSNGVAMNWLTSNGDSTISISGSQSNIPKGAQFSASQLTSGEEAVRVANAVVKAKGNVKYAIYDFNLTTADGQPISRFNGHIDVTMPIPNGLSTDNGMVISVYYVTNAGKLERCNSVVDGNLITFGTSHFSTFVYVEETAASAAATPIVNGVTSPKTADTSFALYVSVLGLAALGMAVYGMGKVKYNK